MMMMRILSPFILEEGRDTLGSGCAQSTDATSEQMRFVKMITMMMILEMIMMIITMKMKMMHMPTQKEMI